MPRRRSRSRRKTSVEDKDSQKSVKIEKEEDEPTGEVAEHSNSKECVQSVEGRKSRLSNILESKERNGNCIEHNDLESLGKDAEESNTLIMTKGTVDNDRQHSRSQARTPSEKTQDVHNNDIIRSTPGSIVSKSRKVFEDKERGESEEKWTSGTNELRCDSEEIVYTSQTESEVKETIPIADKGKCVSSENKRFKNILNTTEHINNSIEVEDETREDVFNINKNHNETRISLSQTSIPGVVDIPPEGTDNATRSTTPEEWEYIRTRRQRRLQRSKDRGDQKPNDNVDSSDEYNDIQINIGDAERRKQFSAVEDQDTQIIPTSNAKVKADLPTGKKKLSWAESDNSENEGEGKISVSEMKQRFSCHTDNTVESTKLKITSKLMDVEESNAEDGTHRSKERGALPSGTCTTELYVASVGGRESSSASFLSAAESNSSIAADEKSGKFKPKCLHSGLANGTETVRDVMEETNTDSSCSETTKVSVKQLKERLISSCSDISEKAGETKVSDEGKCLEIKRSNVDVEKQPKGYENEDFSVSVKERLETYRCQATKAYYNIQSHYIEQDLPSVNSIKELQSSFNKVTPPSANAVNSVNSVVNRSKIKNINEDIVQMQTFSMKCKSCGKQVFFMERIMAEKALWHKKCFRCKECQKQLTVENYKSQDGELYCQSHYNNILKPKPTDNTVSANSVIEEVKIPPLNLKPLFEKAQSTSSNSPPTSPPSVERSPRFLKRLAKFEGTYQGDTEDEENDEENATEEVQRNSTEKKSRPDDLETYLQEECMKKSIKKDIKVRKKCSPNGSTNSSTLKVHLKQFFEKSPDDNEYSKRSSEEILQGNRNTSECLSTSESLKKHGQCAKVDDKSHEEAHSKMSRTVPEETDSKFRHHNNNDLEVTCERTNVEEKAQDVQSVISYFNQQQ